MKGHVLIASQNYELQATGYQLYGLEPEVEVLEPEELRQRVFQDLSRTLGIYETGRIVLKNQEVFIRQA